MRLPAACWLLLAVAAAGCQGGAKQQGLKRLAELNVSVQTRTSRIHADTYSIDLWTEDREEIDEALRLIDEHCRPLVRFSCRSRTLTPNQVHQISMWTELTRLDLYQTPIADSASYLVDLPNLRSLNIAGADAGDAELETLEPILSELESLAVGPNTTDAGLEVLANAKQLHSLFLGDSQVNGEGLQHVTVDLKSLWLDRTKFDDRQAEQLLRFEKLERLGLAETSITDGALRYVVKLPAIDYLSLENTKVTDASIEAIASMKKLYVLDTPGTEISDEAIERLKQMRPEMLIGSDSN